MKVSEGQTRQTQKIQAVGQLVSGIAHDFNNLHATVLGNSQLGGRYAGKLADERLERYFSEIERPGQRGRDVVQQLLTFICGESSEVTPIHVAKILHETASLLRATIPTTMTFTLALDKVPDI